MMVIYKLLLCSYIVKFVLANNNVLNSSIPRDFLQFDKLFENGNISYIPLNLTNDLDSFKAKDETPFYKYNMSVPLDYSEDYNTKTPFYNDNFTVPFSQNPFYGHGIQPSYDIYDIAPTHDEKYDLIVGDVNVMKNLFAYILYNYDTRIRPVREQSFPVYVSTKFVPISILDFDTVGQIFTVLGYFRVWWKDEILTWYEEAYSHTNTIKIPIKDIWKPRLIILRAVNNDGIVGNMESDVAKLSSNGDVQWVPEGIFSVVCNINIQYYPFDKQVCTFAYYVSDETDATVVLSHNNDVTLDEFTDNTAWEVKKVETKQIKRSNTSFITVAFHLHRRAGFVTFTLISPLLMLAFLNVCIFLVPIESGEKGAYSITVFLSYGIFITIVSNTLPPNSLQISYFVLFITVLLCLSVFTVFYTILQSKLVAVCGKQRCTFKFLIPRKSLWHGQDKYDEQEDLDFVEKCVENGQGKPYTWAMVLQRIDTFIFIILLLLVTIITLSFLMLVI